MSEHPIPAHLQSQTLCKQCGKPFVRQKRERRATCSSECALMRKQVISEAYIKENADKYRERASKHYYENRDSLLEEDRKRYRDDKSFRDRTKARNKAARKKRQESDPAGYQRAWRDKYLRKTYGIGVDEYDRMLSEQGGKCAICGANDGGRGDNLHVDHAHGTNEIRGLLCMMCNRGIGSFRDSEQLLVNAAKYLKRKEAFNVV